MNEFRYVPVVLLLLAAIVLAHRPGDVPLALKGLRKLLGRPQSPVEARPNPAWKRVLAFLCTVLAFFVAVAQEDAYAPVAAQSGKVVRLAAEKARGHKGGFARDGAEIVCTAPADKAKDGTAGACWYVPFDQSRPSPVRISAEARTEEGGGSGEALLYVDVTYQDGGHLWGQIGRFPTMPCGWTKRTVLIGGDRPLKGCSVYEMARNAPGLRTRFRPPAVETFDLPCDVATLDGLPVLVKEPPAKPRWLLRDVKAGSGFGTIETAAKGAKLESAGGKCGGAEFFDATLTDEQGGDRALTLLWTLPVKGGRITWFSTPRSSRAADGNSGECRQLIASPCGTGGYSHWPVLALAVDGRGLAIGFDPRHAGYGRLGYSPRAGLLYAAWDMALVPEKRSGRIAFTVFPFAAEDGFRGALEAYQKLFPAHSAVHQTKQGNWMAFERISRVKGWEDFGFAIKEGDNEIDWDDAHGITTYRYTEPTTWWMSMGKAGEGAKFAMPACIARAEALAAPDCRDRYRGYAAAWKRCAMKDEGGAPYGRILDTPWCNGVVWNMNCAPGQKGGEFEAKYSDAHFGKAYRGEFPRGLDGEYVDSSEMYVTDPLDYNRDNFAGMDTPLVFAAVSLRPCVFKGMMGYEYVRGMNAKVRAKGRRAMANGTPGSWWWLAPYLDVMGTETDWHRKGKWSPDGDDRMMYVRAVCGAKPYCYLMNTDFSAFTYEMTEKYMQRSLAYGFFPSFFSANASSGHYFTRPECYERDRPLFRKYMPIVIRVAEAGWRPVNRLLPLDPKGGVFAEQFGDRYVTLFNPSRTETRTVAVPAARELVTGTAAGGALALAPETCRVLDFGR